MRYCPDMGKETTAALASGTLTLEQKLRLAWSLRAAEREARAVPPPVEAYPAMTVDDAYAVQVLGRTLRQLLDGAELVGRKIGLTSLAMQEMLGVDEPDYGCLLSTMLVPDGGDIAVAELVAPRVEAEVAFVLGDDVAGEAVTRDDVLSAVRAVAPALEVIDSRVSDWAIGLVDTVADNASSGRAVIGAGQPLDELDLAAVEGVLTVGGEQIAGRGDAVLGHPAEAVAWLVRALARHGEGLRAGDVVLSGAVARALPVRAGERARADFGALGTVTVAFR